MPTNDLRGATRLAADAVAALADLVEAMHEGIARIPGSRARLDGRTTGITGLVYKGIRGVNRLVGGSADALFAVLVPLLLSGEAARGRGARSRREAVIAALNGVLGDHLAASGNPLAIAMALRFEGHALPLDRAALAKRLPHAGDQVVVLIHGLCMNDLQWKREGHDHGAALARELGFTPVYVHYNTGLRISSNGRLLSARLQELHAAWPRPLKRIVLLGHSMGGLVARSAIYYGNEERLEWAARVSDLVCLGTPHQGAPLERIGHWVEVAVGATPYAAPLARLGRLRSAGIMDLRHGRFCDDRRRRPLPLPRGVRSFALAASIAEERKGSTGRIPGDGLVPVASALGNHKDPALDLRFPRARQAIEWRTNHLQLLNSPGVLATLKRWL